VDFTVNQPSCKNDAEAHDNECTNWDGSLNHFTVEELERSDTDDDEDTDDSDNEEFMELKGDKLLQSLHPQGEREQVAIEASSTFRELQRITKKEWKKAKSLKRVVYSGDSSRTRQR
jgi:hypothetical protein